MKRIDYSNRPWVVLGIALLLTTLLIGTIPGILVAPIKSDASLSLYASQQVAAGLPPYSNYIIMHPPLPHVLGALALSLGELIGVSDVFSFRMLCLVLVALILGPMYAIGEKTQPGNGLLTAAASSLSLLMLMVAWGMMVKLVMLLFYAWLILALIRKQWTGAGVFLGLAILSWSGAIVFALLVLGIAWFAARKGETPWRNLANGFLLAILPVIAGLTASGSLIIFLKQYGLTVVQYATNKLTGQGIRDAGVGLENMFQSGEISRSDLFILAIAALGLIWILVYSRGANRLQYPWVVILASGLAGVGMVLVDYQSPFDLLPLIPAVAPLFAWVFVRFVGFWSHLWQEKENNAYSSIILLVLCVSRLNGLSEIPARLPDQQSASDWVTRSGQPDYSIQAIGDLSLLVLGDIPNLTPVIHAGPKTYLAMTNLGWDIDRFVTELQTTQPGIIILDNRNLRKNYLTPLSFFLTREYLLIGSTMEPNISFFADPQQPEAVRDSIGVIQVLNQNQHPLNENWVNNDVLAAIPDLAIVPLDEFHFLLSIELNTELVLYWWSQPDTPSHGQLGLQWLGEAEVPSDNWNIATVDWYPGFASLSRHEVPVRRADDTHLAICILQSSGPAGGLQCQGDYFRLSQTHER